MRFRFTIRGYLISVALAAALYQLVAGVAPHYSRRARAIWPLDRDKEHIARRQQRERLRAALAKQAHPPG